MIINSLEELEEMLHLTIYTLLQPNKKGSSQSVLKYPNFVNLQSRDLEMIDMIIPIQPVLIIVDFLK
jgi:hypothetical protein